MVDKVCNRLLVRACGCSGITTGKVVYCGVGQRYQQNVIPAIQELSEQKKRVLAIGVYLATSAKSLNERAAAPRSTRSDNSPAPTATNPLEGIDIRFSERGVIDHPKTPEWILNAASEAL
jgi:hypothetical protein